MRGDALPALREKQHNTPSTTLHYTTLHYTSILPRSFRLSVTSFLYQLATGALFPLVEKRCSSSGNSGTKALFSSAPGEECHLSLNVSLGQVEEEDGRE
ncbi:hypothetical protein Baya_2002 [Bagarius yarrelli]|uniref:Uncharacterized protein n=1 Tax=Bagarius yarrelli TaxID=175774 RepID=A0A556TMT2_BAGYA|nr:hypothetical protein Baya_2002 [Bagarius yarrelli]